MKLAVTVTKVGRMWHEQANHAARSETAKALREAALWLMPRLQANAPVATKQLRDGIHTVISPSGLSVRVVQGDWYGVPLSKDRLVNSMPNVRQLQRWVEVKFGKSGVEAKRHAFGLALKMYDPEGKLGGGKIEGNNWWYDTFDRETPALNSQFLNRVGAGLVEWLDS